MLSRFYMRAPYSRTHKHTPPARAQHFNKHVPRGAYVMFYWSDTQFGDGNYCK
jgi:hypothetical protein